MIIDKHCKKRIESINRMLLEVARGNFSYRIERSDRNDEPEALIALANMMTEELEESARHQAYMNFNDSYKHIAQMSFILDDDFHIQSFSPLASDILLFPDNEMKGKPLINFLTEASRPVWKNLQYKLSGRRAFHHTLELSFMAREYFIVPVTCFVSTLLHPKSRGATLVTAIETILQCRDTENELRNLAKRHKRVREHAEDTTLRIILSNADVEKAGKAREYIVNHPEEPDFSIRELAHSLGTNEFKLKYGFKQLYGTTIFRFLQDERLRKANLLVRHSRLPLKRIAQMCGFKTAPHFSRLFKDKYGQSPSDFRRRMNAEKNEG